MATSRTKSSTSGASVDPVLQVITAKEVSIPITGLPPAPDLPEDIIKIRSDFLAGEPVAREDMERMLRSVEGAGGGGSNGNCGIC